MKNLIHTNFNYQKWNNIISSELSKDINTCIGYKKNTKKLSLKYCFKILGFENEYLFFHKKILIADKIYKKVFLIFFFKFIKFISYIYYKSSKFDTYITTDDMSGPLNLIFLKFFKNDNKKIILYLDNKFNNEKYFIYERLKNKKFIIKNDKKFLKKYKNICRKVPKTKKYISFFEKNLTRIFDKLNILPKNPFKPASSDYKKMDVRYVNERKLVSKFLKIDKKKITLKKQVLYTKYKLQFNKKLLIIGMTNWYEHNMTSKKEDLRRNEIMIKYAINNNKNYNILVSLHPKQKIRDYRNLIEKYNIKIIKEPLIKVIPTCNLFVTSFGSSVLQWTKFCKIKSIVLNFFEDKNLNIKNSKYLIIKK
ncbi:hypothetical protein [Candidatus Pelagibacter sp. HIMB1636]|uniref:hypothetical protein n=1 Tax=unclassified Candidatus Pelagibacter TaxID=2647897 RepID=UPI003F83F358